MIQDILILSRPELITICHPVDMNNRELINTIATDLRDTLRKHIKRAVGLSANQIGYVYRMIAVLDIETDEIMIFANPKIDYKSTRIESEVESCLSYPNMSRYLGRPDQIIVSGYKVPEDGLYFHHSSTYEHFQARIFMHEIDHLNGISRILRKG